MDNPSWYNCPKCPTSKRLIAPCDNSSGTLFCPECYQQKRVSNTNLGQVVDTYTDTKTGETKKLTYGKAWEIDNRVVSQDDKKTVINRKTGKEAQY